MSLKEFNRFDRPPSVAPLEVVYPTQVHVRIITEVGRFEESLLVEVMAAYKVTAPLSVSRASSAGRYHAYSVSVEVQSQAELHGFDAALKKVPGVRMVL